MSIEFSGLAYVFIQTVLRLCAQFYQLEFVVRGSETFSFFYLIIYFKQLLLFCVKWCLSAGIPL